MNDPPGNTTISGHDAQSRNCSPGSSVLGFVMPLSHETMATNPSPIMIADTTALLATCAATNLRTNVFFTPLSPPPSWGVYCQIAFLNHNTIQKRMVLATRKPKV